ncbi:MAG: tyrosine recombinase [Alphaproteobacteria bacterium]|nr:tyrosine recombinase [Alphaproteobacteria bacterium]
MFGEQIENFLQMMSAEKGSAQNSIAAYERDLRQFLTFSNDNLSKSLIEDYMQDLASREFAPKSIARKLSAIKEFCKFLYSEKIIPDNPAQNILTPKQQKPLPKFLSTEEISNLIATATASEDFRFHRIAVMIELMYASGMRVSELVALPESAINYKRNLVTIMGKGSKERIVPLAKSAIKTLAKYQELREKFIKKNSSSPWLFPSLYAVDGHLTRDAFYKDLKKLATECGIYPSRISPHVLRHSFATHLINNNAGLRSVQKMLGHENITTTEIYTHISNQKLINAVNIQHPLAGIFDFEEKD